MASLPPYLSDPALWSDYLFKVGEEYGGSASIFFRLQIQFGVAIRRTFTSQTTIMMISRIFTSPRMMWSKILIFSSWSC